MSSSKNNRVIIAMSGGIDSSVAALLMKQQGYECAGITMKLFDSEYNGDIDYEKTCCSLSDIEDARSVAYSLDMPYYVFNFKDSFDENVIRRFVNAYIQGSTPNPCIDCNRFIKFRRLFQRAKELEYDYVVTGHYARMEYDNANGKYLLKKGVDEKKDQSYVLYSMSQKQLAHVKFPLGGLTKPEVRKIAEEHGFLNAHKKESQDICFIKKNQNGDYADFIEKYTGRTFQPGDFVDTAGNILGRHNGIIRYTIGQRRGLGVALNQPMYVQNKCVETNTVTLCTDEELYSKNLTARDINLITVDRIDGKINIKAKVRYNQKEQPAVAEQTGDDELRVEFDSPQRAITRGQAVVLYDGDIVVGGGTIL